MAAAAGDSPVAAAAVWPPSGGMADSSSSSPHALNAEAQQRLDEIFKAHLPEFINILSQVSIFSTAVSWHAHPDAAVL
jgi:hypothetical protein